MKKQKSKWRILIAIGLLCVTLGNTLNHFAIIGDTVTGLLIGIGVGIEIYGLFIAPNRKRCNFQLN